MSKTPPHIAVFMATSGHSGVDRAMQHLIPEIARRGYAVDLLKVRKHGPHLDEMPRGVRIIDLGSHHVYTSLPAVVRYLRRERPAVMLSDKDRVNRTALLARALARTPTRLVLSSGTTISIDLKNRGWFERWLQRTSMGRLYHLADKVIVTSEGVADDMSAYTGLARHLIEVVPSPVIAEDVFTKPWSCPDHPWLRDKQVPVILGVGALTFVKDFETLIKAFAKVRSNRACKLIILGKGKLRDRLLALAGELGIQDDISLPGFIHKPYDYMAHSSLFALTSRWEGLGFVLIEALAVGTPVVSTDCRSGPREILQNGKYGDLVPVGNVDALSKAMSKTLDNPLAKEFLQQAAGPYEIGVSTTAYLRAMGLDPEWKQ
jgi:glycosyltransferase involved in cell wall biosynthesis